MTDYSYQIDPRPAELGGGWRLRLLEEGEEVGGGVFPAPDDEISKAEAYGDARAEASAWLSSREDEPDEHARERRERQDAVDFARASAGLSGFKPSPEVEARAERFINGEIALSEFVGGVNAQGTPKN